MQFDEVFEDKTKYGTKIKTDEYQAQGKNIIVDQGQALIAGYTDKQVGLFTDVPAIVFGDHTRVVKYIDKPFFLGADGVKVLKSRLPDANYKYLYYALLHAKIPNTGYNRHFKWLKELDINYPIPNVQIETVAVLDKVNAVISLYQQQLSKLDELVKARFVEEFGEPASNKNHYPISSLSSIAEYWNGLTYRPEDVVKDGTIVLRSSNIQNGQLDYTDLVRVGCIIPTKKFVEKNDILMCSRNGSAKLVGKVALITQLKEQMTFGAFMMIIRSQYYPYLVTYFQLPAFRRQIQTGATTTINQITVNMLNSIILPIPDIETVRHFSAFMTQVEKSKAAVQSALDKAQLLFDSLMQKYFG